MRTLRVNGNGLRRSASAMRRRRQQVDPSLFSSVPAPAKDVSAALAEASSTPEPLRNLLRAVEPFIPKFLTDDKLDLDYKFEIRRIDQFHAVATLVDRKMDEPIPEDFQGVPGPTL